MNKKSVSTISLQQKSGSWQSKIDTVVVEKPLQIVVNEQEFSITMQTPGDELVLVRGLLHSEGILRSGFLAFDLEETAAASIARVEIDCADPITGNRAIASSSSCGLCGKVTIEKLFDGLVPLAKPVQIETDCIAKVYREVEGPNSLFAETGGCHAASAATVEGEVLCQFEDIGRHNAVDKVVGWLLENDQLHRAALLTVSGRVSFEIIQKCIRARIPILAAISAPSSMAVDFSREYGITLAAFCREDRVTLYSHESRVTDSVKRTIIHA
ncbi:MAG: formate dehydrogenase accessory sulfurtransferase FdhD [Pontiella sp.]